MCYGLRKNLGNLSAFILNYETVFLYILLDSVCDDDKKTVGDIRCPLNPVAKPKPEKIREKLLEYVSFINYQLFVLKIKDNCRDTKNILFKILLRIVLCNSKYEKLKEKYREVSDYMEEQYDILFQLELSSIAEFDSCSDSMGNLLRFVIEYYCNEVAMITVSPELFDFGKHLGMWIYLIDAFEDFEKDIKKNKFNPLLLFKRQNPQFTEHRCLQNGELMLSMMSNNMSELLDSVTLFCHVELIYNIICYSTVYERCKIKEKRRNKNGNGKKKYLAHKK